MVSRLDGDNTQLVVTWQQLTIVEAQGFIEYVTTATPESGRKRQTGGSVSTTVSMNENSTRLTVDPSLTLLVTVRTRMIMSQKVGPGKVACSYTLLYCGGPFIDLCMYYIEI